jgi:hypothetical protein
MTGKALTEPRGVSTPKAPCFEGEISGLKNDHHVKRDSTYVLIISEVEALRIVKLPEICECHISFN